MGSNGDIEDEYKNERDIPQNLVPHHTPIPFDQPIVQKKYGQKHDREFLAT